MCPRLRYAFAKTLGALSVTHPLAPSGALVDLWLDSYFCLAGLSSPSHFPSATGEVFVYSRVRLVEGLAG